MVFPSTTSATVQDVKTREKYVHKDHILLQRNIVSLLDGPDLHLSKYQISSHLKCDA